MAEISLAYKVTNTKIDTLTIDATISEAHELTADTSDHPVEEGSDISDHKRDKPDQLKIEGVISNTPINRGQNARGAARSFVGTIGAGMEARPGLAEAAYWTLHDLKVSGTLISIVTALRVYANMMLVSLSAPRNAKTGDALEFSATFKEIRIVKNRRVILTNPDLPKANTKKKLGTKATKETKPEVRNKSAAKKLADTSVGDTALKILGLRDI